MTDNLTWQQRNSFFFQDRPVHRPNYIVFRRQEASFDHVHKSFFPLVGSVHYTSINGVRRRQFGTCPGPMGAVNSVGEGICRKRLNQTTPKEWTEDPYFVCHLLALAQLEHELNLSKPINYTVRSCPDLFLYVCRALTNSLPVSSSRDQRTRSGTHSSIRGRSQPRASEWSQEPERCSDCHEMAYNLAEKTPVQALRYLRWTV